MLMTEIPRPLLLIVMDGYGLNPRTDANAVALATKPNLDRIAREWPHTQLATSGLAVGLPEGQMGNSEVGHMNIGAGKRVLQDYTRVSAADSRWIVLRKSRAAPRHRACQTQRLEAAPLRPDRRWRRPCAPEPPLRLPAARREVRTGARLHPRLHRRARHLAVWRARVYDGATGPGARDRWRASGARRHHLRALLRDGPRQPLGAHRACLLGDDTRRGAVR